MAIRGSDVDIERVSFLTLALCQRIQCCSIWQDTIQKLTGQLSVAKSALDAYQIQLQDLNQKVGLFGFDTSGNVTPICFLSLPYFVLLLQVSICTVSATESECALREAQKEQISLNYTLSRIREVPLRAKDFVSNLGVNTSRSM
jgi:hypothetical protein